MFGLILLFSILTIVGVYAYEKTTVYYKELPSLSGENCMTILACAICFGFLSFLGFIIF